MNQLELDLQPAPPDYRTIPLTKGQFAIIDAADYEWLSAFKWQATWMKNTQSFYAVRTRYKPETQSNTSVLMSRQIMGAGKGAKVDHRNRDTLDNRRSNLRMATASQNNCNIKLRKDSRTGIKGVTFHKVNRTWVAHIRFQGQIKYLGSFKTPEAAKAVRDEAAQRLHGEFASY